MSLPVILVAFANDAPQRATYLRNLAQEAIGLREVLTSAEEHRLCEFEIITNATYQSIVRVFQQPKYRGRIAIFHYGGHAGNDQLFFKDQTGGKQAVHGHGLVPFLADQPALQLVFLNGCHTHKIADGLTQSGVPAVIGTSFAIRDDVATRLAINFYRGLTHGLPLEKVWKDAVHQINATEGSTEVSQREEVLFREDMRLGGGEVTHLPWSISFSQGKEDAKQWNLPQAAKNPLFGLASVEDHYDLLNEPFEYLKKYGEQGTRNFVGRNDYIQNLYKRLMDDKSSPLVLLYGQSGVGKSSFLNAGLLPRLKVNSEVYIGERTRAKGLAKDFKALLGQAAAQLSLMESDEPLEVWQAVERASDRPLLLVLDQVEEVFTRPREADAAEMTTFLALLVDIFANPQNRPQGKLLMSYRKEFHPEINDAIRTAGLPFEQVFLKKLGAADIQEVVEGISSTSAHRRKYNVTIEAGLPEIVAADLLKDSNSPIAPVLQILLTNLWRTSQTAEDRIFSVEMYNELRAQGIFLEDFFQEQMATLQLMEADFKAPVVGSGLALDILNYHTTEFGTAESRSISVLREQYRHQAPLLKEVIEALKRLYLLSDDGEDNTTLAHDTLGPIVQKAVRSSDKPGQRALRLLATKMLDYELYPERTTLEEEDLAVVEAGMAGMRAWRTEEEALVEKSRGGRQEKQKNRRRFKMLKWASVFFIAVTTIVLFFAWQRSQVRTEGFNLMSNALDWEDKDATIALEYIERAFTYLPEEVTVVQAYHDIYSNNEFYDASIRFSAPVRAIALSPEEQFLAVAAGKEVKCLEAGTWKEQLTIKHENAVTHLAFMPVQDQLVTIAADDVIRFWSMDGALINEIPMMGQAQALAVSPMGTQFAISNNFGEVVLYTPDGATIILQEEGGIIVDALAFSPEGDELIFGNETGEIITMNDKGEIKSSSIAHTDRVLDVAFANEQGKVLSAGRDGLIVLWDTDDDQLEATLAGHERRVNQIQYLPAQNWILSASDDQTIRLWDEMGVLVKTYRGHTDYVEALAWSASDEWMASGGADSTLIIWRLEGKIKGKLTGSAANDISCMDMTADGELLLAGTKKSAYTDLLFEDDLGIFDEENLDVFDGEDMVTPSQDILLFDIDKQSSKSISGYEGNVFDVKISPNKKVMFAGGKDWTIFGWNKEGEKLHEFKHGDEVNALDCSPDGKLLLSGSSDSTAVLWDLATNTKRKQLSHPGWVSTVAFAQNGQRFATGCYDGIIRIFQSDGEGLQELDGHDSTRISCLVFNDEELFSGGWNNEVIRWSENGKILQRYPFVNRNKTGGQQVKSIAISASRGQFAVCLEGGIVKVIAIASGREIQTLRTLPGAEAREVRFEETTDRLIIATEDGIQYWELI